MGDDRLSEVDNTSRDGIKECTVERSQSHEEAQRHDKPGGACGTNSPSEKATKMTESETSDRSALQKCQASVWLCFVVGCLVIMAASSLATFNAYSVDIKGIFAFSQVQVEILAFFGNLGQCAALPTGIFLQNSGPRLALCTAIVFIVPSYLLLWNAEKYQVYYHSHVGLIAFYFFCIGIGSVIMLLCSLTVNLYNFPPRHRGKVVGFLGVLFWTGPAVFAAFYGTGIGAQNFFLGMSVFALSANLLGIIFLHRVREETPPGVIEESSVSHRHVASREHIWPEAVTVETIENDITGKELLKTPTFHLIGWIFVLSSAVDLVYLSNQGIILESCGTLQFSYSSNLVGPIVAAVVNVLTGIMSDRFSKSIPRETFLVIGCLLQVIVILTAVFMPCSTYVFFSCIVIGYTSLAINFTIAPTLVCSYYGIRHFSQNWGAVTLVYAVLAGLLLLMFGLTYDYISSTMLTSSCRGEKCFLPIFSMGAALSMVALLVSVTILIITVISRGMKEPADKDGVPPVTYDSIPNVGEPVAAFRRRQSSLHGSQLIHRSFKLEQNQPAKSRGFWDWFKTS